MNKKVIIGIVAVLIIAVVAVLGYSFLSNDSDDNNVNNENNNSNNVTNNEDSAQDDNIGSVLGKTLIVYYSATGNTEGVAERLAENLNADTFEIVPSDPYTLEDLDWTDDNSRVSKEHDDESLRDVELESTTVPNFDTYDTVLIGYPIWWGIAAWPVNSFVEANDFTGKTVIPFCTSSSSGLGQSGDLFKIERASEYSDLYTEEEANSDARPEFKDLDINIDDYDTIFVGYPISSGLSNANDNVYFL